MWWNLPRILVVCLGSLVLAACGGGGGGDGKRKNPAPAVAALAPASASTGDPAFTLTVTGTGFVTGSIVQWNGSDRATTFASSTQLSAAIAAADVATAGTAQVTVRSPAPGGGVSNALPFAIGHPMPSLSSLSPAVVNAGGPAFTLTATGSGFVSGSVVQWNGADRTTTFVSSTQLTAAIGAADIAAAGSAQVTVRNPSPGGGSSGAVALAMNNAVPALAGLEPGAVAAGSPEITIKVRGTGFVPGAVTRWNGQSLATSFVTAADLVASVPAGRLQTLGDVPVSVWNPPPGGGESAAVPLHVGGVLRLSVSRDGSDVDGGSDISAVSADGRFVAFESRASNLVPGDTNGAFDVFLRDTCLNAPVDCVPATRRVSVASDGSEGNAGSGWTSSAPELSVAISGNGRYVAFISAASNLVPGDTNPWDDVFVRDTCVGAPAGCVPQTALVSVAADGGASSSHSHHVAVSRSGRFVAFITYAGNIVANDANAALDVFVRDTCAGAPAGCVPVTRRATVNAAGREADRDSLHPSFSGDERYVVFASMATNLVDGDTNEAGDIFRHDTCFGAAAGCSPSTVRVSLTSGGLQSTGGGFFPKVSYDGRYVAFVSTAADLVPGDTNTVDDLFLRDTCLGASGACAPTTTALSIGIGDIVVGGAWLPAMSDDARFAVFMTSDYRYVPGDFNGTFDVFLRDACTGAPLGCLPATRRLSLAFDGTEGNQYSGSPAISADGRWVGFSSSASNLVPGGVTPAYFVNVYLTASRP